MEESRQPLMYNLIENSASKFLLCDLGKATRRGIKKCPKCGTYNGTRGFMCKNKACDVVFKDCADNNKRKVSLDAVRLIGIVRRVYSVRVKDRGPDQRGFVQLPLLLHQEHQDRISETALCFVDSCQRLFDNSILNCHEMDQITKKNLSCAHIDSALKSQCVAVPIQFKKGILDSLNVSKDIKDKLWILATEKEGPLVQRVSKTVMAVKCQVSPKHPLGYLHFTFGCTKGKESYDKFYCTCSDFIGFLHKSNNSNNIRLKCVHYYACICALASDSKYSQEFLFFMETEFSKRFLNLFLIHPNNPNSKNVKITENNCIDEPAFKRRISNKTINKRVHNKKHKTLVANILPMEIKLTQSNATFQKKCTTPCWNFLEWLSYVTETINRTMRFENYGSLILLVFSVPEIFFEEFEKRIPSEYKMSGSSSVYRIMNILHVKEIFDTPDVKLKISKRFIHDYHQGYVEYADNDNASSSSSSSGLINSNFIFFLNVGQSTVDESENTNNAFLIEWSPPPGDGSFISRVGHLKLKYKYGRKTIA